MLKCVTVCRHGANTLQYRHFTSGAQHSVSKFTLQTAGCSTRAINIMISRDAALSLSHTYTHTHINGGPSDEISFCHLPCCVTRCISPAKASAASPAPSLSCASPKATHIGKEQQTHHGHGGTRKPLYKCWKETLLFFLFAFSLLLLFYFSPIFRYTPVQSTTHQLPVGTITQMQTVGATHTEIMVLPQSFLLTL